jgi:hypothetical protein
LKGNEENEMEENQLADYRRWIHANETKEN